MKKAILLLIGVIVTLLLLAEFPVREKYLIYSLSNTQYEKLLWLHLNFKYGQIQDTDYDMVIFGSSSALYGFNDSITQRKSLNLGVNTGHRDLDLYLLERFFDRNNSSKVILREFHSMEPHHMNYYGLHPVLHLFAKPSWLLKNGQDIFQPHFIRFIFERARVVFKSYFLFHLENNYDFKYTKYGYRPKFTEIPEEDYGDTVALKPKPTNVQYSAFSSLYHNFNSADRFRKKFDLMSKESEGTRLYYIYFPFLVEKPTELSIYESRLNYLENNFNIEILKVHEDLSFFNNFSNFADFGHLSIEGAEKFALKVENVLY